MFPAQPEQIEVGRMFLTKDYYITPVESFVPVHSSLIGEKANTATILRRCYV
jgi:hypothetical protein